MKDKQFPEFFVFYFDLSFKQNPGNLGQLKAVLRL